MTDPAGVFNGDVPPVCIHTECRSVAKFRLGRLDVCANHLSWAIRRQVPVCGQALLAVGHYRRTV